jgi:hypothetical protein
VGVEGSRLVVGAGEDADPRDVEERIGLPAVLAAQAGLIEDMDRVADALYGRLPPG